MEYVKFTYNHQQRRMAADRESLAAAGTDFNGLDFSNTWIDPIANILMLRPAWFTDAFWTSNSGIYAKLPKTAFTFDDSAKWQEHQWPNGPALGREEGGGWLQTVSALPVNQAVVITWFGLNGGDRFVEWELGYDSSVAYTAGVALRRYTDGTIEVWKNGALEGTYNTGAGPSGSQAGSQAFSLIIIPCLRRRLLVVSKQGGGFIHQFEDISATEESPVITPAAKLWVKFPTATATVQVLPARFFSSGYATSLDGSFGAPPQVGALPERWDNRAWAGGANQTYRLIGDEPFNGSSPTGSLTLLKLDGSPFTPDGSTSDCKMKVALTGDGNSTPFVVAGMCAFGAVWKNTDASEAFSPLPIDFSVTVPDDPAGAQFSMVYRDPDALEADIPHVTDADEIPAKVEIGSVLVMDGMTTPTKGDGHSNAKRLKHDIQSRWKAFEDLEFGDNVPIDTMLITSSTGRCFLRWIANCAGFQDSEIVLPDLPGVYVGTGLPLTCQLSEFQWTIRSGDKGAEWVRKVMDDRLAGWYYGVEPTSTGEKFVVMTPEEIESQPSLLTLYCSIEDAMEIGGYDRSEAWKWVYNNWDYVIIPSESNSVMVTGWDSFRLRPISARKRDLAAIDPTIAPSSRSATWRGREVKFRLFNRDLSNQDEVNAATELLAERLFVSSSLQGFSAWMLMHGGVPVWRSKKITLHGKGDVIINGFSGDCELNDASQPMIRCHYTASQRLLGIPTTDIAWARQWAKRQAINRRVVRKGSEALQTASYGTVAVL